MPQPFVGPPFRVFPSQKSRTPFEAASSPALSHQRARPRRSSPCCRPAHRRPRLHAIAWLLKRLWLPFRRARKHASRSTWGSCGGTDPFRQLHALRSFHPPASPFALGWVASHQRSILSWAYAPL